MFDDSVMTLGQRWGLCYLKFAITMQLITALVIILMMRWEQNLEGHNNVKVDLTVIIANFFDILTALKRR